MDIKKTSFINTVLLALIAGAVLVGLFTTRHISLDADLAQRDDNTITVTGRAERMLTPDIAEVSFYVTKQSADQAEAADYVNGHTKRVVKALLALDAGIERKDIKTTNYSLRPQYDWHDGRRTFRNYRASQHVAVTIHNIDKAPEVLKTLAQLRVDDINGPNMRVDKLQEKQDELRKEAIDDAKRKARELAGDLGVKLSKIVGYSDGGSNRAMPVYAMAKMELAGADTAEDIEMPEINPGEQKVSKTVQLTFKIEQ